MTDLLLETIKNNKKYFIDMDSTINYHKASVAGYLKKWLGLSINKDIKGISWFASEIPFNEEYLREFVMFKIYSLPEFWINLKIAPGFIDFLNILPKGAKVEFLTATPPKDPIPKPVLEHLGGDAFFKQIAESKATWLKNNIPEVEGIEFNLRVVDKLFKGEYLEDNSIVIDDKCPLFTKPGELTKAKLIWIQIGLENDIDKNNPTWFFPTWNDLLK